MSSWLAGINGRTCGLLPVGLMWFGHHQRMSMAEPSQCLASGRVPLPHITQKHCGTYGADLGYAAHCSSFPKERVTDAEESYFHFTCNSCRMPNNTQPHPCCSSTVPSLMGTSKTYRLSRCLLLDGIQKQVYFAAFIRPPKHFPEEEPLASISSSPSTVLQAYKFFKYRISGDG